MTDYIAFTITHKADHPTRQHIKSFIKKLTRQGLIEPYEVKPERDITKAAKRVLEHLDEDKGATVVELREQLDLSGARLGSLLRQLKSKELVYRSSQKTNYGGRPVNIWYKVKGN